MQKTASAGRAGKCPDAPGKSVSTKKPTPITPSSETSNELGCDPSVQRKKFIA